MHSESGVEFSEVKTEVVPSGKISGELRAQMLYVLNQFEGENQTPEDRRHTIDTLANQSYTWVICRSEGQVIGCAHFAEEVLKVKRIGFPMRVHALFNVVLDARYRRGTTGASFMRDILAIAKNTKRLPLFLTVLEDVPALQAYYQRCGFRRIPGVINEHVVAGVKYRLCTFVYDGKAE